MPQIAATRVESSNRLQWCRSVCQRTLVFIFSVPGHCPGRAYSTAGRRPRPAHFVLAVTLPRRRGNDGPETARHRFASGMLCARAIQASIQPRHATPAQQPGAALRLGRHRQRIPRHGRHAAGSVLRQPFLARTRAKALCREGGFEPGRGQGRFDAALSTHPGDAGLVLRRSLEPGTGTGHRTAEGGGGASDRRASVRDRFPRLPWPHAASAVCWSPMRIRSPSR